MRIAVIHTFKCESWGGSFDSNIAVSENRVEIEKWEFRACMQAADAC